MLRAFSQNMSIARLSILFLIEVSCPVWSLKTFSKLGYKLRSVWSFLHVCTYVKQREVLGHRVLGSIDLLMLGPREAFVNSNYLVTCYGTCNLLLRHRTVILSTMSSFWNVQLHIRTCFHRIFVLSYTLSKTDENPVLLGVSSCNVGTLMLPAFFGRFFFRPMVLLSCFR